MSGGVIRGAFFLVFFLLWRGRLASLVAPLHRYASPACPAQVWKHEQEHHYQPDDHLGQPLKNHFSSTPLLIFPISPCKFYAKNRSMLHPGVAAFRRPIRTRRRQKYAQFHIESVKTGIDLLKQAGNYRIAAGLSLNTQFSIS
jgi:hypothetical protein